MTQAQEVFHSDEIPNKPGTTPIPDGDIRLYHQTSEDKIQSIVDNGLSYSHARGIEGPRVIWADERGFYGDPEDSPTIEFHVPKEWYDRSGCVLHDVSPDQIIAAHLPWHHNARYLDENPESRKHILAGQDDDWIKTLSANNPNRLAHIWTKKKYGSQNTMAESKILKFINGDDDDILQEIKIPQILLKSTDPKAPVTKKFRIKARFIYIDIERASLIFETQDMGPRGSRRKHTTQIQINARKSRKNWNNRLRLLDWYDKNNGDELIENFIVKDFILGGDINYGCSCENFLYAGFMYFSDRNKDNLLDEFGYPQKDYKEVRYPEKRNPDMHGICCKHLSGLLQRIRYFIPEILDALDEELVLINVDHSKSQPNQPPSHTHPNPKTDNDWKSGKPTFPNHPGHSKRPKPKHPTTPAKTPATTPTVASVPRSTAGTRKTGTGPINTMTGPVKANVKKIQGQKFHKTSEKKAPWVVLTVNLKDFDVSKWKDQMASYSNDDEKARHEKYKHKKHKRDHNVKHHKKSADTSNQIKLLEDEENDFV